MASVGERDPFGRWVEHFTQNRETHARLEASIDGDTPCTLDEPARSALGRSLQRFALGEGGDGVHLLRKAAEAGTPDQRRALQLLVAEEQAHSALFARGLEHLGLPTLRSHWSDRVFTGLRRFLGLRTELLLFLTAEAVAMPYFVALSRFADDEVIRVIGTRVARDEVHHIAFQVAQLRHGFAAAGALRRLAVAALSWIVAAGAIAAVAVDHGPALRACGLPVRRFVPAALRSVLHAFRGALAHSSVASGDRGASRRTAPSRPGSEGELLGQPVRNAHDDGPDADRWNDKTLPRS